LAVQSANGSNSAENRQAIQAEVSQLKDQINNIAKQTNFNDIKLLDGSAGKVVLQTGVNQNDVMTMKFDSAQTKDLGLSVPPAFTSVGAVGATAIAEGDLLINGVRVGASVATSDKLSNSGNAGSSIAKAAAINLVSDQTGVVATVNANVASPYNGSMSSPTTAAVGTISINGVATAAISVAANSTTATTRSTVVNAINAIAAQTGVTASDGGDDAHGVTLTAADGRNITLSAATSTTGTVTAAKLGLTALSTTYVGSYSLTSTNGQPVKLSSIPSMNISNAGLREGTYETGIAQVVTGNRAPSASAPTALLGTDLMINGVAVGAAISTDDQSTYATSSTTSTTKASSAIATAAAINKVSNLTGVTAKAAPNILIGSGFVAGTQAVSTATANVSTAASSAILLNGVTISVAFRSTATQQNYVDAINQVSGQTGVVASDNGSGMTLVAQDGRTITIGANNGSGVAAAASALGLDTVNGTSYTMTAGTAAAAKAFISSVNLSSNSAFTLASGSSGGSSNFKTLGFTAGTYGGSGSQLNVDKMNVGTAADSMVAITALDAAIKQISLQQSRAGAYQNRLDAVVNNLTESNQNISASRSRILDTDYATETTNLAKSQIISQAATAMLAQANQSGQSVLALLK